MREGRKAYTEQQAGTPQACDRKHQPLPVHRHRWAVTGMGLATHRFYAAETGTAEIGTAGTAETGTTSIHHIDGV